MTGKFYGLGIGPGDPELVTIKALGILKSADVVCVPKGDSSEGSLALSIVEQLLPDRAYLTLRFPMVRDPAHLEQHWGEAAKSVADRLEAGQDVAFVTLGDPMVYSTYIYLQRALKRVLPTLEVETVPGVTSFTAAAALANLPLAEGDQRLAIVPGNLPEEDIRQALKENDTVVLMKVGKRLPQIRGLLQQLGLSGNAVLVSRAGLAGQVVSDISHIDDPQVGYLSLIIVRRDREKLR